MAELETIKVDMQLANVIVASFKATLKDQAAKMETVKEEMQTVLGREAEVMADYRQSMEFVTRIANKNNVGWSATMLFAKHAILDIDQGAIEDAYGRLEFEMPVEGETLGDRVTSADIANDDL